MIFETVKQIVAATRSYRSFDPSRPIEYETMREIIDTARYCPSAANLQPLKYRVVAGEEVDAVLPLTRWAGYFKDIKLPPEGRVPTGYIVMLHDISVSPETDYSKMDVGIAAEVIMLAAAELGYGGCMIGSFDRDGLKNALSIPEGLKPVLVLALGTPDETVLIPDVKDGDTKYFRDDWGLHFVPKRSLEDVMIK